MVNDRYWSHVSFGCVLSMVLLHTLHILYEPYLNHDVAQYLTAGRMILGGAVPYVDLIDTNPPMILYLNVIPAAVSHVSGVPLAVCGLVFFSLLVLIAGTVFIRALYPGAPIDPAEKSLIWIFWLWLSLWTYRTGNFGQREHLIFMFLLPFLLLRYARYSGHSVGTVVSSAIAVLAFVALAMKPFFGLALLAVEVLFLFTCRAELSKIALVTEIKILALLSLLYGLHLILVPGIDSYLREWLPMTVRGYRAYEAGWVYLLKEVLRLPYMHVFLMALLFSVIAVRMRGNSQVLQIAGVAWFALASFIIYLSQQKGWEYQRLPFILSGFTVLFMWLQRALRSMEAPLRRTALAVISIVFTLTSSPSILHLSWRALHATPLSFQYTDSATVIGALTAPEEAVMFIDSGVPGAFPALTYVDRPVSGHFLCMFPLAFIFNSSENYTPPIAWQNEEKQIYKLIEDDVNDKQPRLVLVRAVPGAQGLPGYFIISEYLAQKGFLKTTLKDYLLIGQSDAFHVYFRASGTPHDNPSKTLAMEAVRSLQMNGVLKPANLIEGSQAG